MIAIDPKHQSERDNYKLLIGSIIPRPIAFVISQNDDGIVNAAPFSYFNVVMAEPPLISLSIVRRQGEMKDSARNMINGKAFVVHIVDEDTVGEVNKTAATLLPSESELDRTSLSLVPSD